MSHTAGFHLRKWDDPVSVLKLGENSSIEALDIQELSELDALLYSVCIGAMSYFYKKIYFFRNFSNLRFFGVTKTTHSPGKNCHSEIIKCRLHWDDRVPIYTTEKKYKMPL